MAPLVLVVLLVLSATAHAALPGVVELTTPPDEIGDTRLATLIDRRIADADVIALGETVHGSSMMLRTQSRLIRFLVEKHGFRLILWENPTLRSLELARWVASCATAKTPPPIDVLYMPTPSDVPLFEWICDFNRRQRDDPIVFRGIDIWDRPWEHYARIGALGSRLAIAPHLLERVQSCPSHGARSWVDVSTSFGEPEYAACRAALLSVLDLASTAAADPKRATTSRDDAFELALSASTVLGWVGFHYHSRSDDVLSWNARDEAQGRNIALAMEKARARRAIASAHTSHVSHNRSPADWWGFGDIKSGIHFFSRLTGKQVFNIAFTAYEASGTQGAWSVPTAANSLERKLRETRHRFAFFASDAPFLSEHRKWWMQNQNYPGPYENGVEIVPRDHFDAFFFFDRSHLDQALPARPLWEP